MQTKGLISILRLVLQLGDLWRLDTAWTTGRYVHSVNSHIRFVPQGNGTVELQKKDDMGQSGTKEAARCI